MLDREGSEREDFPGGMSARGRMGNCWSGFGEQRAVHQIR